VPHNRRLVVASSVVAIAGLGGRAFASATAKRTARRAEKRTAGQPTRPTLTPLNPSGHPAPKPVAEKPVLIAARATNGMVGFVRKNDLEPKSAAKQGPASRLVPVYAEDGRTVIGKVVLETGEPTNTPGS